MNGSDRAPGGQLRLLRGDDEGGKLVGWKPSNSAHGGLIQPKGWAALRVVVQKIVEGKAVDLYDQMILVENAGSIVICEMGGKIGLVESFRMVGKRILDVGKDYVRRLEEESRWDELAASLGEWRWELPRGLSQVSNETDFERFVLESAKAEALEEGGYHITDARMVAEVNMNPTFFAHAQYVVYGRVERVGDSTPEPLEIIGRTKLFGPEEVRTMVDAHIIDDGMTMAALAAAGWRF